MRYLIDGYNLLYALGLARKNGGRAAWDQGRRHLLDWLADRHGTTASSVTVALDAQSAPPAGVVTESFRGLRVMRKPSRAADDLIEDLLAVEADPPTLTVVSNDTRVRAAAASRGCPTLRCGEYIDQLMNPPKPAAAPVPPKDEKDVRATPEETAAWERAFGM